MQTDKTDADNTNLGDLNLEQAGDYVIELRQRLLTCFIVFVVLFCALLPFAKPLFHHLAIPLLNSMQTPLMIATHVTTPLLVPIKFALYCAFILAVPLFIHQLWAYFAPAMTPNEQQRLRYFVMPCVALFYTGMWVAYSMVFPILFAFLMQQAPAGVTIMPEIDAFLTTAMKLMLVFGLCFQVPLITFLVCYTGLLTVQQCAAARAYLIVGAFVIGMLLTPPDVVSQMLVAIPIWLLFEVGLITFQLFEKFKTIRREQ